MKIGIALLAGICAFSWGALAFGQGANPPKPSPPPTDVPDLRAVKPVVVCGNCYKPFDTSTHKQVLDGLVANKYIGELRKALYLQDSYHQFESKAHFDNCAFGDAIGYIDSLLAEIETHVEAAKGSKDRGDTDAVETSMLKAFFALGQALHGVQDFYAHSNYVELSVDKVKKSTDIEVIAPWRKSGKDRINEMVGLPAGKGLVSGFVFWGFPQTCAPGTLSHADLAKDKATTPSGKVKVAHLENRSRYQIAVQLAREASQELINDAFRRWPLLKETNGENVAFEVLVDRRGI